MAKRKKVESALEENNTIELIEKEDDPIEINKKEIQDNTITLIEFLEKHNISGYLRQAYIKKFDMHYKLTEKEWFKK